MKQKIVFSFLVVTPILFFCACTKQKTSPVSSEHMTTNASVAATEEADEDSNKDGLTVEEQIDVILEQKEEWLQDVPTGPEKWDKYYAITDLNLDGDLELIATTGDIGSSGNTLTDYYVVDASQRKIAPCKCDGDALPDIHAGQYRAYMDKENRTYQYIYREGRSGGVTGSIVEEGFFSLSDDIISFDKIRGKKFRFNVKKNKKEKVSYYLFSDNKTIDTDKAVWKQARADAVSGLEPGWMYIQWIRIREKDSDEKIQQKLLKSFYGFGVTWQD